jgi:hypothetical protein
MRSGTRSLMVLGFTGLACLGPGAQFSGAQQQQVKQPPQVRIETVFPAQVPRGQSTVLNVAFPGRDLIVQAAEISPSAGVTVSGIKRAAESQGIAWWELTVDVARDAAPGNRSLVLVMPMGRTAPITVTIPSHVPNISDLRVVSAQANQPTLELQFAAADASADLGDLPYVWFTTGCGGATEPLVGAVRGRVSAGIIRVAVPNPHTPAGRTPAAGKCDLQVRATDSGGIESNTLKTTVDFKN